VKFYQKIVTRSLSRVNLERTAFELRSIPGKVVTSKSGYLNMRRRKAAEGLKQMRG